MKNYFAYIRVSTQRQSSEGCSLDEQRAAIEQYAKRNNLVISRWFTETQTAAKRGRPVFGQMLKLLNKGSVDGVIMHKIDRAARNPRDWADLGELIERGVEAHFANESLDLQSRGGRLAADVQAIFAADYIRNLKEEVRKGINGRLRQGLYPWGAPIGYLNMGGGKPKEIDPHQGPLVRQAFELYATGTFSFETLIAEMAKRGLRTTKGKPLTFNGFTRLLNNPFYYGVISVKGKLFDGIHRPIIRKQLYDRVQFVLRGNRLAGAAHTNDFSYRRLIRCAHCGKSLVGERQKQKYIYYRCHGRTCPKVCLSEKAIDRELFELLSLIRFDHEVTWDIQDMLDVLRGNTERERADRKAALALRISQSGERLTRLTDALLDGALDRDTFDERKRAIINERKALQDELETVDLPPSKADIIASDLELASSAYFLIDSDTPAEKRKIVISTTSNFVGDGKYPVITLKKSLQRLAEYRKSAECELNRDNARTQAERILEIVDKAVEEDIAQQPTTVQEKSEVLKPEYPGGS